MKSPEYETMVASTKELVDGIAADDPEAIADDLKNHGTMFMTKICLRREGKQEK